MAKLIEHEQDCEEILGNPFTEVHKYLDQYAEKYPVTVFDEQHRKYLHNEDGITKVWKEFGKEARDAALLHVAKDIFGYIPYSFGIGKYNCHFFEREKFTVEVQLDEEERKLAGNCHSQTPNWRRKRG